jgi:Predicted transcriptional regulators
MAKNEKKVFHCNVELTIDIIGGKWKPLIIHHIGNSGVIRFGELNIILTYKWFC